MKIDITVPQQLLPAPDGCRRAEMFRSRILFYGEASSAQRWKMKQRPIEWDTLIVLVMHNEHPYTKHAQKENYDDDDDDDFSYEERQVKMEPAMGNI